MRIRAVNCEIALLFFSTHLLNESEDVQLRRYTDSIIVKSVKSEQRMVDDIERFLSQVHLDSKGAANTRMKEVQELELGKLHILLVDDDPRNLFAVTAALEQNGAKISCCINGKRALELLEKESFDVIITDIMMPEMDGYQLIEAIRAQPNFFGIPVIVLTAKAMQNEREKILELGADDFLTKPVDYDLLINMVNAWRSKQHLIANQNQ
jgi:CheY-like chemotaxis protein